MIVPRGDPGVILGQELKIRITPILPMPRSVVEQTEQQPWRLVRAATTSSSFVNVISDVNLATS